MDAGEAQLWARWVGQRDGQARDALILMHVSWARLIAKDVFLRVRSMSVDWGEFAQNATVGLIEAIDRYDPARGVGFRAFARHRVRGAVFDGLRQLWGSGGAPLAVQLDRSESLDNEEGDPLEAFAAWVVGLGIGQLLDGVSLHDPASRPRTPYTELERDQTRELLAQAVDLLPERERLVLTLHYFQHVPFTDVAKYMRVTKGRISQLHRQGITRLRDCLREYSDVLIC